MSLSRPLLLLLIAALPAGCSRGQNREPPPSGTTVDRASTVGRDISSRGANSSWPVDADADAAALAELSEQAVQQAQMAVPDAVLRQVNLDWGSPLRAFLFTDPASTQEIDVSIADPTQHPDEWKIVTGLTSPLAGWTQPALDLSCLRVGPATAAAAMVRYAPDSRVRGMTLVQAAAGTDLTWYVFSEVPEGVLSGTVSNDTGTFRIQGPGVPVRPPATATPPP
ncbi:MAG TPA: hypothetical protein VK821_06755 [Dehalococcoidia bacterium]|nr:hypothetical protein [Dehalococcoidia bacterium]